MHLLRLIHCIYAVLLSEQNTIEHYKRVYQYLEEQAPYLIGLIHKNKQQKCDALICEVCYMPSINQQRVTTFADARHYQSHAVG